MQIWNLDFENDGVKQCMEINTLFFLNNLQQFCFGVAGKYQQVQPLFAAELHFLRAFRSIAKTGS